MPLRVADSLAEAVRYLQKVGILGKIPSIGGKQPHLEQPTLRSSRPLLPIADIANVFTECVDTLAMK